jgi:hypothetical protein
METPTQYDWLAMLFLGGGNDLFTFGDKLIEEVKRVGSSSRVAVVLERDPPKPGAVTCRGQVFPGQWEGLSIGETSGDAQSIVNFISDSKQRFPATKRLLALWDHGNGWQDAHSFQTVVNAKQPLNVLAISQAVNQQGIHVLCFDSCLMAMIEIAYELRDKVEFIVASENVVPADSGWPYDAILRMLTIRPDVEAEEVVSAIVNNFAGAYNNADQPITLSALRVSKAVDTVKAIDGLARALLAGCTTEDGCQKIFFARRYSQSFGNPDYIDLVSFCDELKKQLSGTKIETAAGLVKQAVRDMVVSVTRGAARSISGAHGLSIYFPDRPVSPLYAMLDFAREETCLWATFLAMMTPKIAAPQPLPLLSQRPRRRAKVAKRPVAAPAPLTAVPNVAPASITGMPPAAVAQERRRATQPRRRVSN